MALHGTMALLYKDPSFPAESSEATGDALLGVYSRFSAGAKANTSSFRLAFTPHLPPHPVLRLEQRGKTLKINKKINNKKTAPAIIKTSHAFSP